MSKLAQCKELITQLNNPTFQNNEMLGCLCLTEKNIRWLKQLEQNQVIGGTCEIDNSIYEFEQLNDKFIGDKATINIPLDEYKEKDCFFAKNINELVLFGDNCINPPTDFLLFKHENKKCYLYPEDPISNKVSHFLQISELLRLLEKYTDHQEPNKLIFLHNTRVIIPTKGYDSSILKSELDGFLILQRILAEDGHKEEKANILKETLAVFCIRLGSENALEHLILCFGEFTLRFEESYRSFAANFSFNDVRREYEERNREYIAKLNSAFSEVANKLLTLPVSLFLAFSQMKMLTAINEPYKAIEALSQNVGLIVLSLFIYLYIREITTIQRSTLGAIKVEFVDLMARLKSEHPTGYKRVEKIDRALGKRYKALKRGLLFADIVAFIGLITSMIIFIVWL